MDYMQFIDDFLLNLSYKNTYSSYFQLMSDTSLWLAYIFNSTLWIFNYITKYSNLLIQDLKEIWFKLEEVLLFLEVSANKTTLLLKQVLIID